MIHFSPILCVGTTPTMQRTLVFEGLRIDEVNRALRVREFASGKAINVARVVRAMGEKPVAAGFAGGLRGKMLRDDLRELDIQDQMIEVAAPTRLCSTLIDLKHGTATELIEESATVQAEDWRRLEQIIERVGAGCGVWVFSGSLPPGAPVDVYARWAAIARKFAAPVVVDARGEALRLAMEQHGVIVKINREELAATMQREFHSAAELHDAMRAATPPLGAIVVTAGKEGSWVCDGKNVQHLSAPVIQAVNPIGSGDSYAAGLAVGLLRKLDLAEACKLGTACAAANAMTEDAGHVEQSTVKDLLTKIEMG